MMAPSSGPSRCIIPVPVPDVFACYERVVCLFDTAREPMALVSGGAMIVGSNGGYYRFSAVYSLVSFISPELFFLIIRRFCQGFLFATTPAPLPRR